MAKHAQRPGSMAALAVMLLAMAGAPANAETVGKLLDRPTRESPDKAGTVSDLIVNVDAGRVLYIIIDGPQGYQTLPVRALDDKGRLNLDLASAAAKPGPEGLLELRRARSLLGQPAFKAGSRVGIVHDISFQVGSGRIDEVLIRSGTGLVAYPPDILTGIRSHSEGPQGPRAIESYDPPDVEQAAGMEVRPSDARRRIQNPARSEQPR